MSKIRTQPVCNDCGSHFIVADCTVYWYKDRWEVSDGAYNEPRCGDCESNDVQMPD